MNCTCDRRERKEEKEIDIQIINEYQPLKLYKILEVVSQTENKYQILEIVVARIHFHLHFGIQ